MKLIGGEAELKSTGVFSYITDSGRSSLRLILNSGIKNKKFLLPDYLCKVVTDIFSEAGVKYDFYRVNRDLSVNNEDIKNKKFDALYLIDYFGQRHKAIGRLIKERNALVVEDCVFLPVFEKMPGIENWIGFNSFRKISYLPEGSIIKSSVKLRGGLILNKEPGFVELKYKAKQVKYEYLNNGRYSEEAYLTLFSKAEKALNRQRNIYSVSNRSFFNLFEFYKNLREEYALRRKNFEILDSRLKSLSINISAEYNSFYVLNVEKRDALREYLFSKKIFLPVHWPEVENTDNVLYQRVISIPLDSRYGRNDMIKTAGLVRDFLR